MVTFAGRPPLFAPRVYSALNLPWEIDRELAWKGSVNFGQPLALALHIVGDDGRVSTHFRFLPT